MLPDLWNSQWNVFSVLIMTLMLAVGLYKTYRHNNPFSLKKIPIILTITLATQFVFYETLDLIPPFVYAITRVNPLSAFVEIFSQWTIIYCCYVVCMVIYLAYGKQYTNLKVLGFFGILHWMYIFCILMIFGHYNLRIINTDLYYYGFFVPWWCAWLIAYLKFWR